MKLFVPLFILLVVYCNVALSTFDVEHRPTPLKQEVNKDKPSSIFGIPLLKLFLSPFLSLFNYVPKHPMLWVMHENNQSNFSKVDAQIMNQFMPTSNTGHELLMHKTDAGNSSAKDKLARLSRTNLRDFVSFLHKDLPHLKPYVENKISDLQNAVRDKKTFNSTGLQNLNGKNNTVGKLQRSCRGRFLYWWTIEWRTVVVHTIFAITFALIVTLVTLLCYSAMNDPEKTRLLFKEKSKDAGSTKVLIV